MRLYKAALAMAVFAMAAIPVHSQEFVLRFQHFTAPDSAVQEGFMQPWAESIEQASGGRIKIELYPFMQLGGRARDQYDLIRDGAIDGGWIAPSREPGRFRKSETLELPFILSKSSAQASHAAWLFTNAHLLDEFSDVKLLATHVQGRNIMHLRGAPIQNLSDFEGLKLRTPTRAAGLLWQHLGAEPVEMPAPAFPDAMEREAVAGGVATWELAPTLGLGELADSHFDVSGDMSMGNVYYLWAMNWRSYEALPPDLQAVIDAHSGLEASILAGQAHDEGDVIGRERMAVAGHELRMLTAEQTSQMAGLAKAVELDWIVDMTVQGFDGVALLADAKQLMSDVMAQEPAAQ